ncbi:Ribonuclease H [Galdieria sulphuraria]|nr:Ribonuclease H [Galdieria sulphuraria]
MLAGRVSKALTEKTSRRTQKYRWNSSKNKYYAIVGGKNGFTGVVDNWDACKDLVHRGEDFGTFLFHVPPNEPFTCVNPQYKEQGKRILKLYTDGACISNGSCSAKAGYGVYFGDGDSRNISRPLLGQVQTNQRAELSAMIAALESVYSRYVKDILTAGWLEQWKLNHWKRKVGELKNLDLIQRLDYLWNKVHQQSKAKIEIVWVKGHDGLKGNEEADRLATLGIHQRLSRDNV